MVLSSLVLLADLGIPRESLAQGFPVMDAQNFAQNLVSAIENVDQTLQVIEQVQLQTQQVDEMIRNGLAPGIYTWDKVNSIYDRMQRLKNWLERFDGWFTKYGDLNFYRSGPCYGRELGCPQAQLSRILDESYKMHGVASENRKASVEELATHLRESERRMEDEARALEKLQRRTQKLKDGEQMKALQIANQLASAQTNQLLQMRAMMVAQYRTLAADSQHRRALEDQHRAMAERYRRPLYEKSKREPLKTWPGR